MRFFLAHVAGMILCNGCVGALIFDDSSPHHRHKHGRHGGKPNASTQYGMLRLSGPLPADFEQRFVEAAAASMNVKESKIKVKGTHSLNNDNTLVEVDFEAPLFVVTGIEDQAVDPQSKLAHGPLRSFLKLTSREEGQTPVLVAGKSTRYEEVPRTPVSENHIDIDTSMPYGELEAFGREDTAQELTEGSIRESDAMVDQLERAEVSEEKRAVFRALTRLRGAAIASFDGVARAQTGNIDEYNKVHKWRETHPIQHLAAEESDIARWAFPDNADLLQTLKRANTTADLLLALKHAANTTVSFPDASSKL